jgi:hypothetical protein
LQGFALTVTASVQNDRLPPRDKFAARPLLWPVAIGLGLGTLISFGSMTIGVPLAIFCLIALLVWAVVVIAMFVIAITQRYWRRAISLLVILVAIWPLMFTLICASDYIHLFILYPYYRYEIGDAPEKTFPWGLFGFVGGSLMARALIYDVTPKTASQLGTHSAGATLNMTTRRLIGHFYLRELSAE